MVAQIFTDITDFEIRVVWHDVTTGYVYGNRFEIENEDVIFPGSDIDKTDRDLYRALIMAVHRTPEFKEAKRESKSNHLTVTNGNFPGVYSVFNPLNSSIYNVVLHPNKTYCECADHQFRNTECKHIRAAKKHIEKSKEIEKAKNWSYFKKPFYRVVTDISEAEITQAKADLGW